MWKKLHTSTSDSRLPSMSSASLGLMVSPIFAYVIPSSRIGVAPALPAENSFQSSLNLARESFDHLASMGRVSTPENFGVRSHWADLQATERRCSWSIWLNVTSGLMPMASNSLHPMPMATATSGF